MQVVQQTNLCLLGYLFQLSLPIKIHGFTAGLQSRVGDSLGSIALPPACIRQVVKR